MPVTLTQQQADDALQRLANGERIADVAGQFDGSKDQLRYALVKHCGGYKQYQQRVGSTRTRAANGERTTTRRPPVYAGPDDSSVPRITSTRVADGWHVRKHGGREVKTDLGTYRDDTIDVFVAPDGSEYVRASDRERADLIREYTHEQDGIILRPLRLRLLDTSRRVQREQRAIAVEQQEQTRRAAATQTAKKSSKKVKRSTPATSATRSAKKKTNAKKTKKKSAKRSKRAKK